MQIILIDSDINKNTKIENLKQYLHLFFTQECVQSSIKSHQLKG